MANKFDKAINLRNEIVDDKIVPVNVSVTSAQSKKTISNKPVEEVQLKDKKPTALKNEIEISKKESTADAVTIPVSEPVVKSAEEPVMENDMKLEKNQTEKPLETVTVEQIQSTESILINKVINQNNSIDSFIDAIYGFFDMRSFTSFDQLHTAFINYLEKIIDFETSSSFGPNAKKAKKVRFGDRYKPAMVSLRPLVLQYIEHIAENTQFTKAEVIDKIVINGIKVTKFK